MKAAGGGPVPQRSQVELLGGGIGDHAVHLGADHGDAQERGPGAEDHRRDGAPGEDVAGGPGSSTEVEQEDECEQITGLEDAVAVIGHSARRGQQVRQGPSGPRHVPPGAHCGIRPEAARTRLRPRGSGTGDVVGGLPEDGHLSVQDRDLDEPGLIGERVDAGESGAHRAAARDHRLLLRQREGVVGEALGEGPGAGFQPRQPDGGPCPPEPSRQHEVVDQAAENNAEDERRPRQTSGLLEGGRGVGAREGRHDRGSQDRPDEAGQPAGQRDPQPLADGGQDSGADDVVGPRRGGSARGGARPPVVPPGPSRHRGAAGPGDGGAHVGVAGYPLHAADVEGDDGGGDQDGEKGKGTGGRVVVHHGRDLDARDEKDQRHEHLSYERCGGTAAEEGGREHLDGGLGPPGGALGPLGRGGAVEVGSAQSGSPGVDRTIAVGRDGGPIGMDARDIAGSGVGHGLTLLFRHDSRSSRRPDPSAGDRGGQPCPCDLALSAPEAHQ